MPPSFTWPNWSISSSGSVSEPAFGTAPSATTTIDAYRPREWRRRMVLTISSMSKGCSGTRIRVAPPAMPE